jgi:hypothetical protein
MCGETRNGLPKTTSSGNLQSNPKGDHEKVVNGCFKDPVKLQILLKNSTCPKIRAYAKGRIEKEITNPEQKALLLTLVS